MIDARGGSLSDRVAIGELYATFSYLFDAHDVSALTEAFTVDAVLSTGSGRVWRGSDAIREHLLAVRRGRMLFATNIVVGSIDGDEATAHSYFFTMDIEAGLSATFGTTDDRVRKVAGDWKWHSREFQVAWAGGTPALPPR